MVGIPKIVGAGGLTPYSDILKVIVPETLSLVPSTFWMVTGIELVLVTPATVSAPTASNLSAPVVPAGEAYSAHESPNGELGFYLVSTGLGVPYKVHCRAPSFVHMGGAHLMLDGGQLADIVPTFGSINMIGGECDR